MELVGEAPVLSFCDPASSDNRLDGVEEPARFRGIPVGFSPTEYWDAIAPGGPNGGNTETAGTGAVGNRSSRRQVVTAAPRIPGHNVRCSG